VKTHSTNYHNTFIEIAEDCPAETGQEPPFKKGKKSIANYQFEMIRDHPYRYTSDDVFFTVFALRKDIPEMDWTAARQAFFAKGQPCFRASPLTKRYGWGVHSDDQGRVAIYGVESEAYQSLIEDDKVVKVKAMRSKR
jgi:hypothetical protein